MRIAVGDIPEGVSTLELECFAAEIGLETEDVYFTSPVAARLELFKQDDKIFLRAKLSVATESECARCLAPVHRVLEGALENQYRPLPKEARNILDDIGIEYYSGDYIDLSDGIRESLFLELPIKITCSEDCKGLCPYCGQNLNEAECNCCSQSEEARVSRFADLIRTLEIDKKLEV